ncbi:thiamine phosphate synthase [Anderseniella sp. Alg231-50]|uniref:thiamine phosphate synthase n=1 Tax=Anderseniella sp. Alg231-50 TaxID=1922226 RepID=UPI00307CB6BD
MNTQPAEDLPNCRLFLVPPSGMDADIIAACLAAAAGAGDVACLVLPADKALTDKVMPIAQQADIAVLITDDSRFAAYEKADGVHITTGTDDAVAAHKTLGRNASVGLVASGSRHAAMEAGETDIDYIAFDLTSPAGVDLLTWWVPLFEVPCVGLGATDETACLDAIASGADFVMPPAAMWSSADEAARLARTLTAAGNRSAA